MGHFAHDWWCRGGGAAVLALLAVVATFRRPDEPMFWAAVAFFVAHTALAVRRWLRARRIRITATVIRHHDRHAPVFPAPPLIPVRVTRATPKVALQQTKNTL